MKYLKKLWHWLRCEDENGNPIEIEDDAFYPFRYSENIKKMPLQGKIGDDDIFQLSHKLDDGGWTTCFVTIGQLKEALREKNR